MSVRLLTGDAIAVLADLEAGSVDACVTDPPYELNFMSKKWDRTGIAHRVETWQAVLRVLTPGGYLVAFGGTRTFHRLMVAVEDAGFELRDTLSWNFGSGFPKGKGCLKPGWEPIILARKRGASPWLNIDGCRIGTESTVRPMGKLMTSAGLPGGGFGARQRKDREERAGIGGSESGRWPANVVLSHEDGCREVGTKAIRSTNAHGDQKRSSERVQGFAHADDGGIKTYGNGDGTETVAAWECVPECAVRLLDEQSGALSSNSGKPFSRNADKFRTAFGEFKGRPAEQGFYGDTGGASRFYYVAKASTRERNAGMPEGQTNQHPTVKPLNLMSWLVKLVTPPGGVVLDPFMGSGTTGCAAAQLGFDFIGIDSDPEAVRTAERRIAYWRFHTDAAASARPSYDRADTGRSDSPSGWLQLGLEIPERAAHG